MANCGVFATDNRATSTVLLLLMLLPHYPLLLIAATFLINKASCIAQISILVIGRSASPSCSCSRCICRNTVLMLLFMLISSLLIALAQMMTAAVGHIYHLMVLLVQCIVRV